MGVKKHKNVAGRWQGLPLPVRVNAAKSGRWCHFYSNIFVLLAVLHYLCIRQAALGKLKTSFLSSRLHYLCISRTMLNMNFKTAVILFLLSLVSVTAPAKGQSVMVKTKGNHYWLYRLSLADKAGTPHSLSHPETFLSAKAIDRRRRQGLPVDSTDLPLSPAHVSSVAATGAMVVGGSKWNNTLLVRVGSSGIVDRLQALPCVRGVTMVYSLPDSVERRPKRMRHADEVERWDTVRTSWLGVTEEQLAMLGTDRMHRQGFTGHGMTIAVLDGGFMNADEIPCLQGAKIMGCRDFVYPPSDNIFSEMEHGTKVLSTMAVNIDSVFVGAAPDAAYWLLRCEESQTEMAVEEDYWAQAAEFADSVGVDVINSSLGFHSYDLDGYSLTYSRLDGRGSMISRTASMCARKGMVMVSSAGNEGMGTWKKICVPADAHDILTVGAISPNRVNAPFSSVGPTADGRVKPDVMALGSPSTVITGRGTIGKDMGTSFSSPLIAGMVACLWQALPQATALQIIDMVRRSGDNSAQPDNIYGYGVPCFWKAYTAAKSAK